MVAVTRGNPGCRAIIDGIGIGAGVVHRAREEGALVQSFIASESATNEGRPMLDKSGELGFANKRSAAWWIAREMLDPSSDFGLCLPPDDLLIGDLTAPRYRTQSGGRIQVESKDDIKLRIGRSTDSGDAVIQVLFPVELDKPSEVAFVRPSLRVAGSPRQ